MGETTYTVAVAVNDRDILQSNLLASPDLRARRPTLLIQENFPSASTAYNAAIDRSPNDLIIFVHQDVYLPAGWFNALDRAIQALDRSLTNWGVAGSFGSKRGAAGVGRMLTNGMGLHGRPIQEPEEVETLDEVLLVMKKSSGLRFDEGLTHFHLYGVDICLSARAQRLGCFAIPGFCVHNTDQLLTLPKEYWIAYDYIKRKWRQNLPIYTSCVQISRFDFERNRKRAEQCFEWFRKKTIPARRVASPRTLLDAFGCSQGDSWDHGFRLGSNSAGLGPSESSESAAT